MRHLLLLLLLSLLGLSTHLSAQDTPAEEADAWTPGYYMQQATNNVFEKASLMTALGGYAWNEELMLAAAIVEVGSTIALDFELQAGVSYSFLGGGDEDAMDIDLYVLDQSGKLVAADVEDDNSPIADFVAPYSGRYSLRLQLISGEAMTSFLAVGFMKKGGYLLAEEEQQALSEKFFTSGQLIHNLGSGIKWNDTNNQWCLYGLVLQQQKSTSLSDLFLGNSNHYIFGTANQDVDLLVKNNENDLVEEDRDDDSNPILNFSASESGAYQLEAINKSKSTSVLFLGIVAE